MKKKTNFLAFSIVSLLSLSLLSGCGATSNHSATSGSNFLDFSNTSLSGIVTATDDNVITLSLSAGMGGRQMMNGDKQAPPDAPSGNNDEQAPPDAPAGNDDGQAVSDTSAGNDDEQTPPDIPADDTNNSSASDIPSGDSSDNEKRQKPSDNRSSTTFTLTITDDSVLQNASLSDITEGSLLTITFGDDNTITSITTTDSSN